MTIAHRTIAAALAVAALLASSGLSRAETVRIGLPTKTYWPTTVAEAAKDQKLFEKEGITAELTIYRGGAEAFEALAAGAADLILDAPSLPAAGRKKGVMSKVVANGAMGNFGWQLMVLAKSPLDVKDLNGKKVGITSAGSGSDLLALWTVQDKKIDFTRVPVGGGGLVPNLLAGNIDAAVVYSPLSFQIAKSGEARTILDYAKDVPPNLTSGWIATDKYVQEKPAVVQKAINALYGGLMFMRNNREAAIKLIAGSLRNAGRHRRRRIREHHPQAGNQRRHERARRAGGAAVVARHGQARRHEGSGAGRRDHRDRVQAGPDQAMRF